MFLTDCEAFRAFEIAREERKRGRDVEVWLRDVRGRIEMTSLESDLYKDPNVDPAHGSFMSADELERLMLGGGAADDDDLPSSPVSLPGAMLRPSGKYASQIRYKGKKRHIGTFITDREALRAYDIAREEKKRGRDVEVWLRDVRGRIEKKY